MAKKRHQQSSEEESKTPRGVRAFWSGTISFGLVNVPVSLFPANRSSRVALRMLSEDGTPLERRYYCPQHETDVHREHMLRGYQLEGDQYVIIRDDELEAIEPKKTREFDLRQFVDLSRISPMFFDRAYYLTPRGDTNKAYRLLAHVMQESGRAGIATFVMRDREYLVAILAENGILRAQTLRFQDELRTPEDIGLPPRNEADQGEVKTIERLVKQYTVNQLDARWLEDEYAKRVRKLVEKKSKSRENVVQVERETEIQEADEGPQVDLLQTIRRSLQQQTNGARSNGRRQKTSDGDLKSKSKDELYDRAQQLNIPGRSKMNKQQLIREISRASS